MNEKEFRLLQRALSNIQTNFGTSLQRADGATLAEIYVPGSTIEAAFGVNSTVFAANNWAKASTALKALSDSLKSAARADPSCRMLYDVVQHEIAQLKIPQIREQVEQDLNAPPAGVPDFAVFGEQVYANENRLAAEPQVKETRKMNTADYSLANAVKEGVKLMEGKALLDAVEAALKMSLPEEQKKLLDTEAIRHIVRFATAFAALKGGGVLVEKFGDQIPQIGHVQEVGFKASQVEVMQSLDSVIKVALPFLTQFAKNFISNKQVQKTMGLPAGVEQMITEDAVESLLNQVVMTEEKKVEVPA